MTGFRSREFTAKPDAGERPDPGDQDGPTVITATRDGSLHFEGRVVVMTQEGEVLADADDLWFCRCGRSGSKPFCDGSHKGEFESRLVQVEPERRRAETPAAFEPNPRVAPPPEVDPAA
jgi:CDGSH-type Zn-finger protein